MGHALAVRHTRDASASLQGILADALSTVTCSAGPQNEDAEIGC